MGFLHVTASRKIGTLARLALQVTKERARSGDLEHVLNECRYLVGVECEAPFDEGIPAALPKSIQRKLG